MNPKVEIISETSLGGLEIKVNNFYKNLKRQHIVKTTFESINDGICRRYIYIIEYDTWQNPTTE